MVVPTNDEEFVAWLENQPRQVHIAIAARAALRAFPAGMDVRDGTKDERKLALLIGRAILCSAVAALVPTAELKEEYKTAAHSALATAESASRSASRSAVLSTACLAAYSAAISAADSATDSPSRPAAHSAAHSATAAAYSASRPAAHSDTAALNHPARFAAYTDCSEQIENAPERVFDTTAWPDRDIPQGLKELSESLLSTIPRTGAPWSFWRNWYEGLLNGKPLDWELQKRVALIPDEVWETGVETVAEAIQKIEAELLLEKTPIAEKIEFDHPISKFKSTPIPANKKDLLSASLSQVDDALEDALSQQSNGLHENCREARVLRRTITKYGNDPQRIEMDFASVHAGLVRQLASDELPASEDNLALQRALDEGGKAIRATHPEVAENRAILNAQQVAELTEKQKTTLADAQPILEAISDHQLGEDFAEDIPFLLQPPMQITQPTELQVSHGHDEKVRVISRATKMLLILKKTPELIHKIDGSAGYKGARILTTLAAIVALGLAIF